MTQDKLNLPSDLDEAAKDSWKHYTIINPTVQSNYIAGFIAGAEWMASKLVTSKGYREITDVRTSAITATTISKTAVSVTDGKPHNPSMLE